jgi:hypothetical protein
LAKLK